MADTNNTGSNSDLDIKIGISIEDYKSVAIKVQNMLKQLENETKIGIKVDFKNVNSEAKESQQNIKKTKQEVLELSRGYKTLANEVKKMYKNQEGVYGVSVTEMSKTKRQVDSFTATITKNNGEVEKLSYSYDKAAKGFVLLKKEVTDVESLMTPKQKQKVENTRYNYKTNFQNLNNAYSPEILENKKIKSQIDEIQLALKNLNKADLKQLDNEITKINNSFKRLKSDANTLKKEIATKTETKTETNTKKAVEEENVQVLKLSQNYNKLLTEVKTLYKDSGEIKVITEGDIDKVKKFAVELERIKGLKEKISYTYDDDKSGFVVDSVKINNTTEKEIALKKEQAEKELAIKQAKIQKEIELEKKASNTRKKLEEDTNKKLEAAQKEYYLRIEKYKRENSEEMLKISNQTKLKELENQVKNLNNISTDDAQDAIKNLGYAFRRFDEDVKAGASNNWADTFAKNTAKFFSWYVSANLVMQTKQFFMDSIRSINNMDKALVELNKVADLSSASLDNMKQSAIAMGKELGKSSIEVMNSMAEFGRITKNAAEIKDLSYVATLASNVTSLSADEAAKALNTTILSMKLNLTDSMGVLNQFNEIQNNYRTSAEDLADSIGEVGAIATQTGVQLNQLNGYTTALVSSTGISGSEAGTAWVK